MTKRSNYGSKRRPNPSTRFTSLKVSATLFLPPEQVLCGRGDLWQQGDWKCTTWGWWSCSSSTRRMKALCPRSPSTLAATTTPPPLWTEPSNCTTCSRPAPSSRCTATRRRLSSLRKMSSSATKGRIVRSWCSRRVWICRMGRGRDWAFRRRQAN